MQLSGGEPTIHPQILEIVALAKTKRIKAVMTNTNGVRLVKDEEFVRRLSAFTGNFEIYLQFDGFRQGTYEALRGLDLREVKTQAIVNLTRFEIPSIMHGPVMLMKGGSMHERTEPAHDRGHLVA